MKIMKTCDFLKQNRLKGKKMQIKNACTILLLGLLLLATVTIATNNVLAAGPTTVLLGTAADFSVLAGSGITNTGPTTIYGDVGTFPTPSQTGFGSVTIIGTNHVDDAVTQQAKIDLVTAYNDAAGRTPVTTVATELGGTTLVPGVYNSESGTFQITGTVTLDGQGDPNAVFIFQMESTLVTASSSVVLLTNGTHSCNVFWQVGSSATIGTSSSFVGTILALTSITLTTGATVDGRVLARNGAVTMDTNTIGQTVHLEGITLTPTNATNPVGTSHTINATVAGTGDPVPNRNVNFTVISGPNAGLTGSAITDSNGHASFTYVGNSPGTDTIQASFENSQGVTVVSSSVTKTWTPLPGPAMIVSKQVSSDNATWIDADLPPGLLVTVGSNVYYRFNVTNIGNVALSNVNLTDNTYTLTGATVPTLAPGESFVYYYGPVSALLGQQTNTATGSGQYDSTVINDTDNANYNGLPESIPSISVVKQISGDNATWVDANLPPGISVVIGANVYYRFNVTNTGNVELSNITLTDNTYDLSGAVIPPTLAPGASFVYYFGPVSALSGQHTNIATANGQYEDVPVSDTDNANYNGVDVPVLIPDINVIKQISGDNITWVDADTAPGLNITICSKVYYKFNVTNTGNVTLTNITLTDNTYKLCVKVPSSLAPGESFIYYYGSITAQSGQHKNIATATGTYNGTIYIDTDKAYYYGTPKVKASIDIIKYVSVDCGKTWSDANCAPGPTVLAGKSVYFKFEVKNTGNVPLTNISLADVPFIDFSNANIPDTLQPGKSFKVIIGPICAGLLQNCDKATVNGTYANVTYSDCDVAHYYGSLCTYTACSYAGTGTAGKMLNCYYKTAFSTGLQVGYYDSNLGYGYKWTNTKVSSLQMFLKCTGTNGIIKCDTLNPVNTKSGGGSLAVQTATLTINIALGNMSIKGMPNGLADLHYCKTGDSLNNKTVSEILAISNSVLGGQPLPQGYTYTSLNSLIQHLNEAFANGQPTSWARAYLKVC
jgi:uncharacterized membrane protein